MKKIPSFAQVSNALAYDPLTGLFTWKDRPNVAKQINNRFRGTIAGSRHAEGYWKIFITINGIGVHLRAHRVAWLLMTGVWPSIDIDHIDGVKDNNRWSNLREASRSQNGANRKGYGKSGLKGSCFYPKSGKWRAFITINRKTKSLGSFDSAEEAHAAYCEAAEKQHGEFAYHLCR